ncbi:MAG TPA: extracellular solute-binding protein [Candidatus Binatia bacterium]|jgi:iron(III) transport system substrate-binding protein
MNRPSRVSAVFLFVLQVAWLSRVDAAEAWKSEWEKTIQGAKREGQVTIYGPHNPMYRPLWEAFQKIFPGVKIDFVPGKGADLTQKILTERRADKYLADLLMGGSSSFVSYPTGALERLRPHLILPETYDESAWWQKKLWFADPQNQSAILLTGEVGTRRGSYNTTLLDPKEIQSWWDLLQPKYKGKLGTFDPLAAGGGGEVFVFFYHSPALGAKFITRLLGETDILVTRDLEQGTDWLGRGKIVFYIGSGQPVMRAKQQGLPVDLLPHPLKEGEIMGGGACCMALLNRAPHPNAAKVFINWVLSREGQIAWQKYSETNSLRMDIPKDDLPSWAVPQSGVDYFMLNASQNQDAAKIKAMQKAATEALRKAQGSR